MLASPFFRRLFLPSLLLICVATAAVGVFGGLRLRATYLDGVDRQLRNELKLVEHLLADDLAAGRLDDARRKVESLGAEVGARITVIRADGAVLADNRHDPATMDNHRDRPEVVSAAVHGQGMSIRGSDTLGQPMEYMAMRVGPADKPTHFVRLALPVQELDTHLAVLYWGLAAVAFVSMAVAGVIAFVFARRQAGPMIELTAFAAAVSRGGLTRRIHLRESGEFAALATSLNAMADSLNALVAQTQKDNAELLAIITSMSEAVIATDTQQRILLVNDVAGTLLGFDPAAAHGKLLWELVRHDAITKAAHEVMAGGEKRNFQIGPSAGRYLDVTISTFPQDGKPPVKPQGLVIVAHDATQAVRYQELRKEFVANVSHEFRTPLTVIKGFVETLQDGAMNDGDKARQYLATIARHAEQLTNLVNDVLELSRLESLAPTAGRVSVDLGALVRKVVHDLQPAAQLKRQTLTVETSSGVPPILGNPDYLDRAVSNLVDNALKYTPPDGRVAVATRRDGSAVVIEVTDNGIGVPPEDVPRIFERFYRVDRSRSREMGGTGLGLSIVKHVAQAHGGTIDVTSAPGQGSTFRLKLPLSTPD